MAKSNFNVVVRKCDHVQHKGWVSRDEVFDTFEIEAEETEMHLVAHQTFQDRHADHSDYSATFTITKLI